MAKPTLNRTPSYLSYEGLAAELDMSETTVRELVKTNVIPKSKLDRIKGEK